MDMCHLVNTASLSFPFLSCFKSRQVVCITNLKGVKSLCHNEPGAELYPDKTHMLSMGRIML